MKHSLLVPALAVCAAAALAVSCDSNRAKVSGRIAGPERCMVVLEQITATGAVSVDSTATNRRGNFRFNIELPPSGTTFYNLRIGEDRIPLFVSPGEKVTISSMYGNPGDYIIRGSRESILVKELNDMMNAGAGRLDSLSRLISTTDRNAARRTEYIKEYGREYSRLKREQIKFIVTNSRSLAALYALYQRLPDDKTLFNGNSDIIYYRLVADSVSKYYPDSPYVAALRSQVDMADANEELARMVSESICNPAPYPDIALPDMYGDVRRLSSIGNKVILLDFWSAAAPEAAMYNAELKEIYSRFAGEGFEIYQVGIDTDKQVWINAVQEQRLPCISVCDFKGPAGIAPRVYNIDKVPANYLIDGNGEIVGRDIPTDKLAREVDNLVRRLK